VGWVSPTGYNDPYNKWSVEASAYDDRISTYAWSVSTEEGEQSRLELTHAALNCDKVRFRLGFEDDEDCVSGVVVAVYYEGGWHNVYSGGVPPYGWNEASIAAGTKSVTAMYINWEVDSEQEVECDIYEVDFHEVVDGKLLAEYQYDELSRRTLLTLGNDANAVYDYDLANRLKKLTNNISDANSIVFDYSDYDKVGNRLSCKIDDADAHVYEYDNLYQLTCVDYNDGNITDYYYDSLGNRTKVVDGGTTNYKRNRLNQYTSVGDTGYSYDENGNLADDGTYKYYYDCENRLTDVNDQNDAAVASYSYDYSGRRVKKTLHASQTTIHYTYDGDQVIAENEGSQLVRKFIYGPGIDEPILMIDAAGGNAVYYYHFDGLGSVAALSNNSGEIVERYSYDVFGRATIRDPGHGTRETSLYDNPYFFTGRRYDDETGLYYYRARYYDPWTGRFIQTDPVGYAAGLNLYTYCSNNPLNWIDPLGLAECSPGDTFTYERCWRRNVRSEVVPGDFQNFVAQVGAALTQIAAHGTRYLSATAGVVGGNTLTTGTRWVRVRICWDEICSRLYCVCTQDCRWDCDIDITRFTDCTGWEEELIPNSDDWATDVATKLASDAFGHYPGDFTLRR